MFHSVCHNVLYTLNQWHEGCVQIVLKLTEEMRGLVHRMAAMELAVVQVNCFISSQHKPINLLLM